MELHAWGCCGWFLSYSGEVNLSRCRWVGKTAACRTLLEKSKDKLVLYSSDWEKCWFWAEPLATSCAGIIWILHQIKQSKRKFLWNSHWHLIFYSFPCYCASLVGETASKQPPREWSVRRPTKFSHNCYYNNKYFVCCFVSLSSNILSDSSRKKKKPSYEWQRKGKKSFF